MVGFWGRRGQTGPGAQAHYAGRRSRRLAAEEELPAEGVWSDLTDTGFVTAGSCWLLLNRFTVVLGTRELTIVRGETDDSFV